MHHHWEASTLSLHGPDSLSSVAGQKHFTPLLHMLRLSVTASREAARMMKAPERSCLLQPAQQRKQQLGQVAQPCTHHDSVGHREAAGC